MDCVLSPWNKLLRHRSARVSWRTWAREVVTAYQQAMVKGTGAISVGDRMIDMASVRMAQMILKATEGE
jgi:citrate lyase beta subunit